VSHEIFLSERFRAIVREYPKPTRVEIGGAIDLLQASLGDPHRHAGLGIRKLASRYFEMRVGLDLRLVFRLDPETISFVFAGTHDEVRRFLKQC
jgi:mRNA-degrading endonuclease YafQ of YafQ-DinJ toxin-antitoxin module